MREPTTKERALEEAPGSTSGSWAMIADGYTAVDAMNESSGDSEGQRIGNEDWGWCFIEVFGRDPG